MQGHFPEAEKDPVIQIASMVTVQGEDHPTVKNVMTLKGCAPIVGAEVMAFEDEVGLLRVSLLSLSSGRISTGSPLSGVPFPEAQQKWYRGYPENGLYSAPLSCIIKISSNIREVTCCALLEGFFTQSVPLSLKPRR